MERLRQTFENTMHTHLAEIQMSNNTLAKTLEQREHEMHMKTLEMEEQMQQEIEKLKAEREREMAAMEQRYATQPDHQQSSQGVRFATPPHAHVSTPSLETISRIKKSRGVSRRTQLFGVIAPNPSSTTSSHIPHSNPPSPAVPTHPTLSPPLHNGGKDNHSGPQGHAPPVNPSAMAEVVGKAVEAALRNLLYQKNVLEPNKRSPRR
ncbi:hypothetical protein JVT61DRAFT_7137 [Boletus reticuloceps]|uniref:Uncharacterized protein n=1 Tax=Boletus reticuloceps TaxID=495285 RepID=A0A8I3A5S6_9AGAM|nr:hypothetical protein JVT61DRAFT_7137 [Boletus reticuloceps]